MIGPAGNDEPGLGRSDTPTRADAVEALFAPTPLAGSVRAYELWGDGAAAAITEEEAAVVANAVENRRRQFAAGRHCAHRAIIELGTVDPTVQGRPILRDANRAPVWPPGVVGSISHTEGYAVATVADAGISGAGPTLGVDAEQIGRVTDELHDRLFLPSERVWLDAIQSAVERDEATTLAFGAKEAFYKAQYPVTGAWVGFHDVELRPDPVDRGRFTLHPATDLDALRAFAWPLSASGSIRRTISTVAVVAIRASST